MNNIFQTSSLNIVAWLMTNNYKIKDTKKLDDRTIFYFDKDDKFQEVLDSYNQNEQLKIFISNFRKIKTLIKTCK